MSISAISNGITSQSLNQVAPRINADEWSVGVKNTPRIATANIDLHNITANEMRSLNITLYEDGRINRDEFEQAEVQYSFARGVDQLNKQEAEKNGRPYESTLGSKKFDLLSSMRNSIAYDEQDGQTRSAQLKQSLLAVYEQLANEPGRKVSVLA